MTDTNRQLLMRMLKAEDAVEASGNAAAQKLQADMEVAMDQGKYAEMREALERIEALLGI